MQISTAHEHCQVSARIVGREGPERCSGDETSESSVATQWEAAVPGARTPGVETRRDPGVDLVRDPEKDGTRLCANDWPPEESTSGDMPGREKPSKPSPEPEISLDSCSIDSAGILAAGLTLGLAFKSCPS